MAKLKASGHACPFTTGWQTWTQLESFSAWHNVPFLTKDNGFAGPDAKLVFNGPVQMRHIENMQDWIKKGYFVYGGRKNEPEAKFYSGECAMMTTSSAAYGTIKQNAKFKFAESTLPYYADVAGAPQNTIIGGASLWVMGGKKKEEYKAVAKFLTFLSQPDVQAEFSQATGYLPITMAAYELTKKSGFYEKNPGTNVAVEQMIVKTTNNSRGVRAGNFPQIRDVMDEELEAVWAGKKTAKQGLDDAVKRGNEIIERFNKANNGLVRRRVEIAVIDARREREPTISPQWTRFARIDAIPTCERSALGRRTIVASSEHRRWKNAPASNRAGCPTR